MFDLENGLAKTIEQMADDYQFAKPVTISLLDLFQEANKMLVSLKGLYEIIPNENNSDCEECMASIKELTKGIADSLRIAAGKSAEE